MNSCAKIGGDIGSGRSQGRPPAVCSPSWHMLQLKGACTRGRQAVAVLSRMHSQHCISCSTLPPAEHLHDADKQTARRQVKQRLKALSVQDMAQQSRLIAEHVLSSEWFRNCRTVGIYIHCAKLREVDTSTVLDAALQKGKQCFVPLIDDKQANMRLLHIEAMSDLHSTPPFGILEPDATYPDGQPRQNVLKMEQPLDVLVMPGLGFDSEGRRLGRGGGYYDKFVARLQDRAASRGWRPPLLVGLAFQAQMHEPIPVDPHDKRVDVLVTPSGLLTMS